MSIVLPQSVNYSEGLPSLPEQTIQIPVATNPVNLQTATSGQQIQFDLLNRGFLVPDSLFISYTYTATNLVNAELIGCPIYTSFSRVDVQAGSQTIETINSYNILMNMMSNLTLSVSDKYGLQSAFGYFASTGVPSLEQLDGRLLTVNETGTFSGPLPCILSNADKLLPLFAMPQMRLILTVESIANMFTSTVAVPTAWTLSNIELRYKVIDMGSEVENMVRSMGDKIYIKSQSFSCSSTTLAAATNASVELIFNQRYASVKSLFAINGVGTAGSNRAFDSVDLTVGTGDYQFIIGGVNYPQRPISARTNRSSALQELRSAIGSIYDKNNSFAINSVEFGYNAGTASTCTYNAPGKYYLGTSTERLGNSNSILSGISTQNSPISYRINTGASIGANASTITLVVNYDALFEVDTVNRQLSIKS
jgi:hypothetical protein